VTLLETNRLTIFWFSRRFDRYPAIVYLHRSRTHLVVSSWKYERTYLALETYARLLWLHLHWRMHWKRSKAIPDDNLYLSRSLSSRWVVHWPIRHKEKP